MNEAQLCVCRRRRVAAAQRGERQKGERREGVEERSAAPRGSIHHTSGGAIRTWGRGEKKKGFEVWTSKRLHALFPKNNVGLKQMRSLRCPNKVQNKTKGKERASAAAASTETLEGNNKGDNATAVLLTGPRSASLLLLCGPARKRSAVGTVRLSKELHTVSSRTTAGASGAAVTSTKYIMRSV